MMYGAERGRLAYEAMMLKARLNHVKGTWSSGIKLSRTEVRESSTDRCSALIASITAVPTAKMPNILRGMVTKAGTKAKTVTVQVGHVAPLSESSSFLQTSRIIEHPKYIKVRKAVLPVEVDID